MEKDFRCARRGGADLKVGESKKICRQVEAGGKGLLRGPATEAPVRASLEKAQGGEDSRLAQAQPVVVGGDVGFGLFQPVDVHWGVPRPFKEQSTTGAEALVHFKLYAALKGRSSTFRLRVPASTEYAVDAVKFAGHFA